MMSQPFNLADAENILRRLFRGGQLRQLPRSRRDTELFIALAAATLDPQASYSEEEINDLLIEWLRGFTCSSTLDHVTIRRCLVDYRMLLRDDRGASYRANQAVLGRFIEPEARSLRPLDLFLEVQQDRADRRRHATTGDH